MHWKLKKEKLDFYDIKGDVEALIGINTIDIIQACKNEIKSKLVDIKIFDLYQGGEIKEGFKSVSLRLILQDCHTMTNKEISMIVEKCIRILKNKFHAEIRHIPEV
uniref:FDX-ACB domain-containing protein n=1 Tax=Glossina pallidipes TaxID=7398 RepID=A0A1A9Z0U9_GLOPL